MSHPAFPGSLSGQDPDLTARQRHVFTALLALHGDTARPVSSDSLGRVGGIDGSSATIRSTLAELEAMGLLARAHASSGRVPSPQGYAFFVRRELTPAALPPELLHEIDERLQRASRDVERLLAEASRVLSRLTRQLGIAVATPLDRERLGDLDLAPLGVGRTLLVLSLGGGAVHTLVLQLENAIDRDELEEAKGVLRERLLGLTLLEVRDRLTSDAELVGRAAARIVARAAKASWDRPAQTTVFSAGAAEIASQPEFADQARLASLLRVVGTGTPLDRLMVGAAEGQPAVRVALDEDRALAGCSLVSFALPGRLRRAVGVLGPVRMDYARVFSIVDAVGRCVADLL